MYLYGLRVMKGPSSGDADNGGGSVCWGASVWETSVSPLLFGWEPKTDFKKQYILKDVCVISLFICLKNIQEGPDREGQIERTADRALAFYVANLAPHMLSKVCQEQSLSAVSNNP